MQATLSGVAERSPRPTKPLRATLRVRLTGTMSRPPRVRAAACAVVLFAALGTAAGCGDDGATVTTKDGDKVSVDTDGDKVTIDTDDGSVTVGQGLPDGFPADDVPLLDEKVVSGAGGDAEGQSGWTVIMQTSRAVDDLTAEVRKDFADAGYTTGEAMEAGDVTALQFESDQYEVGVTAARTGGNVTVTYLVRKVG